MIRFIVMVLYLVIVFIISLPLFAFRHIQRKINPQKSAVGSQKTVVFFFKGLWRLSGGKAIIKGKENVPTDQPVLYVANHRGIFDVIVGYQYVKNNTGFIAKDSLRHVPLIGTWMYLMNCLFLNRTDIKAGMKTILDGINLIKAGSSVLIFPEGTRSIGGDLLPFKEGSLKIAEKSGCLIVPVAITGTEKLFENQSPKVRPSTVVLEFGQPIDLKTLDKHTQRHCGNYIRDLIIEMRSDHENIIAKSKEK